MENTYTLPDSQISKVRILEPAGTYTELAFFGVSPAEKGKVCCLLPFNLGYLDDMDEDQDTVAVAYLAEAASRREYKCEVLGSLYFEVNGQKRRLQIAKPYDEDQQERSFSLMRDRIDHPGQYAVLEHWILHYTDKYDTRVVRWSEE